MGGGYKLLIVGNKYVYVLKIIQEMRIKNYAI